MSNFNKNIAAWLIKHNFPLLWSIKYKLELISGCYWQKIQNWCYNTIFNIKYYFSTFRISRQVLPNGKVFFCSIIIKWRGVCSLKNCAQTSQRLYSSQNYDILIPLLLMVLCYYYKVYSKPCAPKLSTAILQVFLKLKLGGGGDTNYQSPISRGSDFEFVF